MEKPVHCGADYCNVDLFNPTVYLNEAHPQNGDSGARGDEVTLPEWNLKWVDTFATATIKGRRLLDFGCGPCVNIAIPASRWFDEIVLSEYGPQNREAVQDWIDQKPSAYDWAFWSKLAAEKEGEGITHQDVQRRTRQRIKEVIPCDIHKDNPFDPKTFGSGFFDCIASSLCLDSACADEAEYRAAVKKLATYLKPGGHLVMSGVLLEKFYSVGGRTFRSCAINADFLEETLREAGFKDFKIEKANYNRLSTVESDGSGFYFVKALKS